MTEDYHPSNIDSKEMREIRDEVTAKLVEVVDLLTCDGFFHPPLLRSMVLEIICGAQERTIRVVKGWGLEPPINPDALAVASPALPAPHVEEDSGLSLTAREDFTGVYRAEG